MTIGCNFVSVQVYTRSTSNRERAAGAATSIMLVSELGEQDKKTKYSKALAKETLFKS